jgi:hypothetical protein
MILIIQLAEFTTLKGAKTNAKPLFTASYDDKTVLWLCENKANQSQLSNAAQADRINFLLFFFLNLVCGYADKNV